MPELDTVRGIAILLVVFFHGFGFEFGTTGLSGLPKLFVLATLPGWMGVNLFFVLSGFLITGILLDSRGTAQFFKTFYVRRALRILPAYYLLLLVLWIVPRIGIVDHRQISWQFIAVSLLFLSNVANLFAVPMQYGPLWSLAVEEHFYLYGPRRSGSSRYAHLLDSPWAFSWAVRFFVRLRSNSSTNTGTLIPGSWRTAWLQVPSSRSIAAGPVWQEPMSGDSRSFAWVSRCCCSRPGCPSGFCVLEPCSVPVRFG